MFILSSGYSPKIKLRECASTVESFKSQIYLRRLSICTLFNTLDSWWLDKFIMPFVFLKLEEYETQLAVPLGHNLTTWTSAVSLSISRSPFTNLPIGKFLLVLKFAALFKYGTYFLCIWGY